MKNAVMKARKYIGTSPILSGWLTFVSGIAMVAMQLSAIIVIDACIWPPVDPGKNPPAFEVLFVAMSILFTVVNSAVVAIRVNNVLNDTGVSPWNS